MNRETLAKRIAALRQMTTERGCTEAEALAAATKAAELMQEYGLSESDIEFCEQAVSSKTKGRNPAADLWPVIAHCTNTASIIVSYVVPPKTEVTFVGKAPGPQIATYLLVVLNRAIANEVKKFKASTFYRRRRSLSTKRKAVADFTVGLVWRLRERLLEIFAPAVSDEIRAAAHDALAERYPAASSIERKKHQTRYDDALWNGWDAGDNVNLSHGVSGSEKPLAIGGAA
ncbi:DUF7168 domain-containing protein [Brucella anthropi]|uniref:DUF7168 domain-containing protein n=1 Tax=Brucella anthropi TaxID=529 RepID=UPI00124E30EC|nr:DUF2786 domain-containing protein [Brucella anthropi]KAB2749879.1 DUF2786 domain-containing protein [Brucella anthropi]